jgi:WD repeat-containing protein 23
MASNQPDARASSEDDSDYAPTEEDDEAAENIAQLYLEQLLAGEIEPNDETMEENDEEDDGGEDDIDFGGIEVEIEEENNQGEAEADNAERSEPYMFTLVQILVLISRFAVARTRRRVLRLLQNSEIGRIFRFIPDDDDDDDGGDGNSRWSRRQRNRPDPNRFPKVPSDKGTELMNSGLFGSNPAQAITARDRMLLGRKKKLALRIMERELAIGSFATEKVNNRLLAQGMIPSSNADMIIHYDEPVYSGTKHIVNVIPLLTGLQANFPMTETSSSLLTRTTMSECTIRRILINGDITRPSNILSVNGRLQMLR